MKEFFYSLLKKARKLVSGYEDDFRRIPLITGIFQFLYKWVGPKGIVLADVQGYRMFMDAKSSGLVLTGCWEKDETEIFKRAIREGMTVVDIGAHIGYYAIIAAGIVGRSGKVYAFEPEMENYSLLLKNIELNNYNNIITPCMAAVSDRVGKAKLFLDTSALHSLLESENKNKSFVETDTTTLDEFLKDKGKIDIIKMDAEGAEYMILKGMGKILESNNNITIFTEFYPALLEKYIEPQRYLDELVNKGFKIYLINKGKAEAVNAIDLIKSMKKHKKEYSVNLLCKR